MDVKKIHFLPNVTSDRLIRRFSQRPEVHFTERELEEICQDLKLASSQVVDAWTENDNVFIRVHSMDGWTTEWQNPHKVLEQVVTTTCRSSCCSHQLIAA